MQCLQSHLKHPVEVSCIFQVIITHGGDVVTSHNHLRDTFAELCHRAHLPGAAAMLQNVESILPMMPGVRSWGGCASH